MSFFNVVSTTILIATSISILIAFLTYVAYKRRELRRPRRLRVPKTETVAFFHRYEGGARHG